MKWFGLVSAFDLVSAQDLNDARAKVSRLQETVKEQEAVIEQQERDVEEYAQAEPQAWEYYDESDKPIPEATTPWEELYELGLRSTTADEPGEDDAEFSASHRNESQLEQPKLKVEEGTLQQLYEKLEIRARGLQGQDKKI